MYGTAPRIQQVWRELDDSVSDRSSPRPSQAPKHRARHLQGAAAVCTSGMLLSSASVLWLHKLKAGRREARGVRYSWGRGGKNEGGALTILIYGGSIQNRIDHACLDSSDVSCGYKCSRHLNVQGIFRMGGNLQRVQQAVEELEDLKTLKFHEVCAVVVFMTGFLIELPFLVYPPPRSPTLSHLYLLLMNASCKMRFDQNH